MTADTNLSPYVTCKCVLSLLTWYLLVHLGMSVLLVFTSMDVAHSHQPNGYL